MGEQSTGTNNIEAINNEVSSMFERADAEIAALKKKIREELTDYKDMLARERRQADIFRNKIQVRDVMEMLLPILSDIKNDVADANNLEDVQMTVNIRYKQLKNALSRVGIKLLEHERGQIIDLEEKSNGGKKVTTDPSLHQRVACSNKMGCIIKGEEDFPILEDFDIYVCEALDEDTAVEETAETEVSSEASGSSNAADTQSEDTSDLTDEKNDEKIPSPPAAHHSFDVSFTDEYMLRFEKALALKSETQEFPVIEAGTEIEPSFIWKPITIPDEKKDRALYILYLGSLALTKEFAISSIDLEYRVCLDETVKICTLEFAYSDRATQIKTTVFKRPLVIKE